MSTPTELARMGAAETFTALTNAFRVLDGVLAVALEKQVRLVGLSAQQAPSESAPPLDEVPATQNLAKAAIAVPTLARVADALDLTDIDLAAILIALAPEIDLGYERIISCLQSDSTRTRPTSDFIAGLLAPDMAARMAVGTRFRNDAPLLQHEVLTPTGASELQPLARMWRVDPLWRNYITGTPSVAADVGTSVRLMTPSSDSVATTPPEGTVPLDRSPVKLLLRGPHGAGKFSFAQAVAISRGQKVLIIDVGAFESPAEIRRQVRRADRAALLCGAIMYLHGLGRLEQREPQVFRALMEAVADCAGSVVLTCVEPLPQTHTAPVALVRIDLQFPDARQRFALWRRALGRRQLQVGSKAVRCVSERFSLSAAQIEQATAEVEARRGDTNSTTGFRELAAAARMQCGSELERLARRITPQANFRTIIAPPEVDAQLREICARVSTRELIRNGWARGSVHARSIGVTALFAGASGCGKTLSAEALANELGFDLYRIDLSGIVSKYIGETEKNLDRVFAAAEHANAVLFFDEADALFGKRSEVKDAHDRYANIEIAYLLQKMEQFDGLAILATNLKQNLDEAFARRLTFTVTFPFPEETERKRLWEQLWPARAPRADDVDLGWFAREFRLSGGNIRNAVMAAAHLAVADGKVVTHAHLMHATRREFQKLGKNIVQPVKPERRTA